MDHFGTIRIFHRTETPDWRILQLFPIIHRFRQPSMEPGSLRWSLAVRALYMRESGSLRVETDCLQILSAMESDSLQFETVWLSGDSVCEGV